MKPTLIRANTTPISWALDLIVFKDSMNNSHTKAAVVSYASILTQVQQIMPHLQGNCGGVTTNYRVANA
jgi:hypothetical protein